MTSVVAFVALGSNLGDRAGYLRFASESLAAIRGLTIERSTPPEDTLPLAGLRQPTYLNAMLRVRTDQSAETLLQECHLIEQQAGRDRSEQWASRTLDIDVVRFGDLTCDLPRLTLPHPGLRDREFWARQIAALEADD
jgi:2-amino-4-hydroxy-6-hydroxymethyldihydropteridine diphosphokinase